MDKGDPEVLADLLAAGERLKPDLLRRAGGLIPATDLARRLGISPEDLDDRRRAGRLIALPRADGFDYPACQFVGSRIQAGLEDAFAAMTGISNPWMRLEWLITEDDALDGQSPLEALLAGRRDEVSRIASGCGT